MCINPLISEKLQKKLLIRTLKASLPIHTIHHEEVSLFVTHNEEEDLLDYSLRKNNLHVNY